MFYVFIVGLKQAQASTSESTSIIINNVQRPNQADTPRPSMSFKSNVAQQQPPFYFSPNRNFLNETEIQEIRNDDMSKSIVYGPAMTLAKQFESPIPNMVSSVPSGVDLLTSMPSLLSSVSQFKQPSMNHFSLALALHQMNNIQPFLPIPKNSKPKKPAIEARKPSTSCNYESKSNSLQRNYNQSESMKQQNVQSLLPCRIPSSISISVMPNDESESANRSMFNSKNNVVNSIEIVKLPDESSNETNAKFASPSPSSSNSDKAWYANKNQSESETFQTKFMESLNPKVLENLKKPKPPQHQKQIRPNTIEELVRQEALKRKLQQNDDKSTPKVRKLQPSVPVPQSKSISTTQRPIPDLLIPKDDKKTSNSTGINSQSSSSGTKDRQSPTVSNVSSSDKPASVTLAAQAKVQQVANENTLSKYMPLQTSMTPLWKPFCTAAQTASHKALAENLNKTEQ